MIEDTGIGIGKEDLPRIFERGYTGYNGRIEKKSTGIGLYLSRRAADKLSHKLYATSEVGKGSKFYIDTNTYKSSSRMTLRKMSFFSRNVTPLNCAHYGCLVKLNYLKIRR